MAGTAVDSIKKWLPRLADALFPRRCPFCGALLGADALQGTVCPACVPEEMRLQHIPPRLPEGEHSFYALSQAAAAYYYADTVRSAILEITYWLPQSTKAANRGIRRRLFIRSPRFFV
mgnify:CR=1 FL=1